MPKYTNANVTAVDVDGIHFDPLQTISTYQWIGTLPNGVTKVADAPYVSGIISSAKISTTTTVQVPVTLTGNYKISVYCNTVEVSVKLNSSGAVAKLLGAGELYEITCLSRTVDNIIVTVSSGVAYVTIEKI